MKKIRACESCPINGHCKLQNLKKAEECKRLWDKIFNWYKFHQEEKEHNNQSQDEGMK